MKHADLSSTQDPQPRSPTSESPSDSTDDESHSSISVAADMASGKDADPVVEAAQKTTMNRTRCVV